MRLKSARTSVFSGMGGPQNKSHTPNAKTSKVHLAHRPKGKASKGFAKGAREFFGRMRQIPCSCVVLVPHSRHSLWQAICGRSHRGGGCDSSVYLMKLCAISAVLLSKETIFIEKSP